MVKIVEFPMVAKVRFLKNQFGIPAVTAGQVNVARREGYGFTEAFLQCLGSDKKLQALFDEGRILNAVQNTGFGPQIIQSLNRGLKNPFVVRNDTFALESEVFIEANSPRSTLLENRIEEHENQVRIATIQAEFFVIDAMAGDAYAKVEYESMIDLKLRELGSIVVLLLGEADRLEQIGKQKESISFRQWAINKMAERTFLLNEQAAILESEAQEIARGILHEDTIWLEEQENIAASEGREITCARAVLAEKPKSALVDQYKTVRIKRASILFDLANLLENKAEQHRKINSQNIEILELYSRAEKALREAKRQAEGNRELAEKIESKLLEVREIIDELELDFMR